MFEYVHRRIFLLVCILYTGFD